jgi:hypothetical protein
MQSLNLLRIKRGVRTSFLSCRYCQQNMARPAGIAIFIQDKPKGLANKAEVRDDDAERPPDSKSNDSRSEDKGNSTPGSAY